MGLITLFPANRQKGTIYHLSFIIDQVSGSKYQVAGIRLGLSSPHLSSPHLSFTPNCPPSTLVIQEETIWQVANRCLLNNRICLEPGCKPLRPVLFSGGR